MFDNNYRYAIIFVGVVKHTTTSFILPPALT